MNFTESYTTDVILLILVFLLLVKICNHFYLLFKEGTGSSAKASEETKDRTPVLTKSKIEDALLSEEWPGFAASISTMSGYEERKRIRQELKRKEEKNESAAAAK